MRTNLESSLGLVFSQPVLLALVESGLGRDDAYRLVQRSATRAVDEQRPFIDVLRDDPAVVGSLGLDRLVACFDLGHALANAGRSVDALAHDDAPGAE
jgi:adenylosuccinate lyase